MREMYRGALTVDSWIREAQEALKLVEDMEAKVRNKSLVDGSARSKLLEVGIKLDRLESLLHNPPSNLVLTEEDLGYRWKMLSDVKLRTRDLAQCLYALSSPKTTGGAHAPEGEESSRAANSNNGGSDQTKISSPEGNTELLSPLIANDARENDGEIKRHSSFTLKRFLWSVFWTISAVLGAAAVLIVLVILTALI